jgi:putative chitinase
MIDKKAFFAHVRASGVAGKPLKQRTVESLEAIIDAWDLLYPNAILEERAYTMATARHEAWDPRQQQIDYAIEEIGGANREYGRTGFFGRGLSQLTHRENYDRVGKALGLDLVNEPDLALRKDVSASALIMGSVLGWYRGDSKGRHTLGRYFPVNGAHDPVGARNIINGDVTKNGPVVARHYIHFLAALKAAEAHGAQPVPPPAPTPVPVPAPLPEPAKPWYMSKTLWGAAIAFLSPLIARFVPGFTNVAPDTAADWIIWGIDFIGPMLGGTLAAFGRVSATKPIAGTEAEKKAGQVIETAITMPSPQYEAPPQLEHELSEVLAERLQGREPILVDLPLETLVRQLPEVMEKIRELNAVVGRPAAVSEEPPPTGAV